MWGVKYFYTHTLSEKPLHSVWGTKYFYSVCCSPIDSSLTKNIQKVGSFFLTPNKNEPAGSFSLKKNEPAYKNGSDAGSKTWNEPVFRLIFQNEPPK